MVNVGHQSNGRVGDPTHHISLQTVAGANETGFICVGEEAYIVKPEIQVRPYPGQATQFVQGRSKHADKVPPFIDVSFWNNIGGMGMLHYDEDESRYLDGYMMNTSEEGRTILQGRPTYTKGIRDFNEYQPDNDVRMTWRSVYASNNEDTEVSFVTEAAYNADKVRLYMRKVGSPTGNITVELRTSGDVNMDTATLDASNLSAHSPYFVEFDWDDDDALSDATTYKININYAGGDADNYIQIWYDTVNSKFPYRVLDDTEDFDGIFFELNGAMYFMTQPLDRSASKLYLYGYRGVADANTGALSTLVDGAASWTADEWIGGVVKIVAEDGTEEREPYRTITDNDATTLTVSSPWKVEHTTETEYVLMYPKWKLVQTLDQYCMSVTVALNYAIFGFESGAIEKYEAKEFGGAFSETLSTSEQHVVNHVLAISKEVYVNSPYTNTLYGVHTATSFPRVTKHDYVNNIRITPKILAYQSTLMDERKPFDLDVNANVTVYLRDLWSEINMSGAVTGTLCGYELPATVDIRGGRYVRFLMLAETSTRSAGDIQLKVEDSNGDSVSLDLPELTANEWTLCELEFTTPPEADTTYDASSIAKIYFVSTVSVNQKFGVYQNAPTIGVFMYGYAADSQWYLPQNTQVNSMFEYSGGAGEIVRRPWIGTWRGLWYLNGDMFTKLYLGELEEFEHPDNCKGICVNGPYLHFNLGERIERYHAGQLDDIGPDRD